MFVKSNKRLKLVTLEHETLVQRIARNIAWYALRIARPSYTNAYKSAIFYHLSTRDPRETEKLVQYHELLQADEIDGEEKIPVPVHHVIFRG